VSKYHPLFRWFNNQNDDRFNVAFQQVEGVLGFDLPCRHAHIRSGGKMTRRTPKREHGSTQAFTPNR
jgi:hypothetical protein